jgi:hypothetical protein
MYRCHAASESAGWTASRSRRSSPGDAYNERKARARSGLVVRLTDQPIPAVAHRLRKIPDSGCHDGETVPVGKGDVLGGCRSPVWQD